jgi:uncharacterized protein
LVSADLDPTASPKTVEAADPESPEDSDHGEDEADFAASADARPPPAPDGKRPWLLALAVTAVVAITFAIAFQPDKQLTAIPFLALAFVYSSTGLFTLFRMRARHELSALRLRGGDVSIAGLVGGLLYGLAFAAHVVFTSKGPRAAWVFSVYLLLGDPFSDRHHLVAIGLAVIGMLEELTWRGLVLPALADRSGALRASVTTSILYATAHMPTMFLLGNDVAGPNPLLVLAALGCGLVWSYLRYRTGRLVPAILAHGLFTWAIVEFPIWRP